MIEVFKEAETVKNGRYEVAGDFFCLDGNMLSGIVIKQYMYLL